MHILLIDNDETLQRTIGDALRGDGCRVCRAGTCADGRWQVRTGHFEVLLVAWDLPDGGGLEVVRSYRALGRSGGTIVMTTRDSIDDRVAALEAGADHVMVKPFEVRELRARIRALLRRPSQWVPRIHQVGDLTVDCERRCAVVGERTVELTPKEWMALQVLARRPGRLVSRTELVSQLWDENHEPETHALEVHLSNLRTKLATTGAAVRIVTRRGAGYRILPGGTGP